MAVLSPKAGLPPVPSFRIKSMFAVRDAWTPEEAAPYLEKFVARGIGGASLVADLFGKFAKAKKVTEKDANEEDVSITKFVAIA